MPDDLHVEVEKKESPTGWVRWLACVDRSPVAFIAVDAGGLIAALYVVAA